MMTIRQRISSAAVLAIGALLGATAQAAEAPAEYQVKFETTAGDFTVDVHRDWAPKGADRFHELVKSGYYDDARFFRVVPGFVVQFGMAGDPELTQKWKEQPIADDPVKESNKRGTITFATSGPNSRTTQVFINYGDNARLDNLGFAPFGLVSGEGMQAVDKINAEYREQPSQLQIGRQGNEYLKREFPKLDYIKKATIVEK
jgi:peptidyl-prolyl cis-trans isomerase A (cyclophilin A)